MSYRVSKQRSTMKVGLATLAFKHMDLKSAVLSVMKYTDYVMISPIYEEVQEGELQFLRELRETYGTEYVIHGPFPNFGNYVVDRDGYDLERLKPTLDNAYRLESSVVVLHPTPRERFYTDLQVLKELYRYAEDLGITICIENKPRKTTWLVSEEDFDRVLDAFPDIKFCIDTSHYFIYNPDSRALSKLFETYHEYIECVHVADTTVQREGPEQKVEDLQMVPGYGDILWYVVTQGMKKLNLRKVPLILEVVYPVDEIPTGITTLRHLLLW